MRSGKLFRRGVIPFVAVLLLAAGILKLYGLRISHLPAIGVFSSPRLGLGVALWEVLLAAWLLFRFSAASWLAATVTFTGFALVSGYFGLIGVANCGCFGAVKASPFHVLVLDLLVVTLLVMVRPRGLSFAQWTSCLRPHPVIVAAVLLLTATLIGGRLAYGSFSAAAARINGEHLTVDEVVDFGAFPPRQFVERDLHVSNWSETPIRIIGGTSDCSCIATKALPVTVPAGVTVSVTVQVWMNGSTKGVFTRRATFITDLPEQPTITFHLTGQVE